MKTETILKILKSSRNQENQERVFEVLKKLLKDSDRFENYDEDIRNYLNEILFSSALRNQYRELIDSTEAYFVCENCSDIESYEESHITDDDMRICDYCRNDNYVYTYDDRLIHEEDSVSVVARYQSSRNPRHRDYVFVSDNDRIETCIDCNDSFETRNIDNIYHDHANDGIVCEYCYSHGDYHLHEDGYVYNHPEEEEEEETDARKDLLENTNDRWTINPPRKMSNYHFLGLEIETEIKDESLLEKALENSINHESYSRASLASFEKVNYCLKSDGSLKENGVEIVFHHTDSKTLRKNVSDFFQKNNKGIRAWDCGAEYGIHIHLEREKIPYFVQERILEFFLNPENHDFLIKIARRKPNRWWSFVYSETAYENCIIKKSKHLVEKKSEKYRAINVTSDTLEFRIFRSTINNDSIFAYLDFVSCLLHFCKRNSNMDFHDFVIFAKSHKKAFQNLNTVLEKIGEN